MSNKPAMQRSMARKAVAFRSINVMIKGLVDTAVGL